MSAAIALHQISKSFGQQPVLRGIDLVVRPGEFLSLVGPSGCGKSTLLRVIAGLEAADGGQVCLDGQAVDHLPPAQRRLAMVFQSYALYPHLTVAQNMATPLRMARLNLWQRLPGLCAWSSRRKQVLAGIQTEVAELAQSLQLEGLLQRKPAQLSGGQRQRVALARAMIRQPAAFLMDEPLSNLDAQLRIQVRDELADLHQRLQATFVYVTHDQTEAMTLSGRVAVMDAGRLLQVDTPRALYEDPHSRMVAGFVGQPAMNLVDLPAPAGRQWRWMGQAWRWHGAGGGPDAWPVCLGVRPEHLGLVPREAVPDLAPRLGLAVRVLRTEHHGADGLVACRPEGGGAVLQVRLPSADPVLHRARPGDGLTLVLDPGRLLAFGLDGRRLYGQVLPVLPR